MSALTVDDFVRMGDLERAAALARAQGQWKRAAELLSVLGRTADAVVCAVFGKEWSAALDIALTAGDEQVLDALAIEIGEDAQRAQTLAAQCLLARREDVAARVLEATAPLEAAQHWYNRGDHQRAAQCFDRGGEVARAMRAYEQHVAQTPEDAVAAERLGELRAQSGDDAGAVRALQTAVRAGAGDATRARLVCGLLRLGYEHGARAWIERLRASDPTWPNELEGYRDRLPRTEGAERRYAGRYRVIREVGSGATGRVLEALDELTGDPVALKVLSVSDDRSAAFGRFMREAELGQSIDDPALVPMRALDPEGPTIVYDWMPGGTLEDRMDGLTLPEVRAVTFRVLGALETLHRNGVVHRDVKPTNILFDAAGQARLGDLGAAHLGDLGATVTGGLVGSLPYMSPEQITGQAVSASTDFYALGCVLYRMLTARLPFAGPDFVAQHMSESPPRASAARPGLDTRFDVAIASMLAKDPFDRPQDARELRAVLSLLPWDQRDLAAPTPSMARMPSIPPGAPGEGARLVPAEGARRWTDLRMNREVERLLVPRSAEGVIEAWVNHDASELQPVLDVIEHDDHLAVWVEPLRGVPARVESLSSTERTRVHTVLSALGVAPSRIDALTISRSDDEVLIPIESVLTPRATGESVA